MAVSKPVEIKADVLNDLASRFLINIPEEDRGDPVKLCSHIELAHWFYLDLQRPEDPSLPACSMKEFMATIFRHCPFLVQDSVARDLDSLIAQWKSHKFRKPVRGAIILNQNLTKCLLVQGYPASISWGFPKGKLEEGESDMDSAVREVYEETGFDARSLIMEERYLEAQLNDTTARMYLIPGVPEETPFAPRTRKEIRDIQWFRIDDLPRHRKDLTSKQALGKNANSFFTIIPFMSQLRKWIASYQQKSKTSGGGKPASKTSRRVSAMFQAPEKHQQLNVQSQGRAHRTASAPAVTVFPSAAIPPAGNHGLPSFPNTTPVHVNLPVTGRHPGMGTGQGHQIPGMRPPPPGMETQHASIRLRSGSIPVVMEHPIHHHGNPPNASPHPTVIHTLTKLLPPSRSSTMSIVSPSPHDQLFAQQVPAPLQPVTGSYHLRGVYPAHLIHPVVTIVTGSHFTPMQTQGFMFNPPRTHFQLQMHPQLSMNTAQHLGYQRASLIHAHTAHQPSPVLPSPVYLHPSSAFLSFVFKKGPILSCLKE